MYLDAQPSLYNLPSFLLLHFDLILGDGLPSWGFAITLTGHTSVGLLWTSDQPVAETSTSQHTTLTIDIHAHGRIRTRNPSKGPAGDPRLRPRGQRGHVKCVPEVLI